ncbi:fungal specific transcription factor domain-containing protein [Aspergillus affinis]|uniref:fungal specific transcription factor domain-containing protein n=1 Tax=Aspergillus affinis TaxID=1070780 RepID=UPI0022FE7E5A|nr:uncharacterized protein KD926_001219 [Aspergillus affinis]KAI9036904.1 hypothetical protein KD926_001219 [Aspergillus affinis]
MVAATELPAGRSRGNESALHVRRVARIRYAATVCDRSVERVFVAERAVRMRIAISAIRGLVSRPLNNDEPTRGFFGDSSTIAFLKQLQDTFRSKTSGPLRDFPCQSRLSRDLESLRPNPEGTPQLSYAQLLPTRPLADHLVDCYFSKIHLWEPDKSPSSTRSTRGLGLGDENVSRTTFYYGLNAIFATGCQLSNIVQRERQTTSEAFFQPCKPTLDVDYLETCDLALTQSLLLMTHYVQSSQTPNRSWHAIGTACRLAQGIGLHSDAGNETRSFPEIQIRRRVWHACVMLDLAISIILGQPVMISQAPSTPLPDPIDDRYLLVDSAICEQSPGTFSRLQWFIATLNLYDILRKALNYLYDNYGGRFIKEPLERRRAETLHWDETGADVSEDPFLREKYLLKARFLSLKILICRPVLSQSLRETYLSVENESLRSGLPGPGIFANLIKGCSVFREAAIDLISLVHETCSTDLASVWFYNVFYSTGKDGNSTENTGEHLGLSSDNFDQMPFSENLFRDLEFDGQTIFDPFWFNMDIGA